MIIASIPVVIHHNTAVVVGSPLTSLGCTVDIGDKTEVLINLSDFTCRILAVDILAVVPELIIGGVLNLVMVSKGVDVCLCADNISILNAKAHSLTRRGTDLADPVDAADQALAQ